MKKTVIFLFLISLLLLNTCSKDILLNYEKYPRGGNPFDPMGPSGPSSEESGSWVFMVYLDAANNLESAGVSDINEMIAGSKDTKDLTIYVLMDRIAGYSTASVNQDSGDWQGTKLYKIQDGTLTKIGGQSIGGVTVNVNGTTDVNMGNKQSLIDFINYCKGATSADYYLLDLWNHGGGWRTEEEEEDLNDIRKAICWDDESSHDTLYMSEVRSAIKNSGIGADLKVIYMDACLMQMIEVCYELRDLTFYLVASEETVPGNGGDYTDIFSRYKTIYDQDEHTPYRFSYEIVSSYRAQYSGTGDTTLSAIDVRKIEKLTIALNTFAEKLPDVSVSKLKSIRDKTKHFAYPDQADLYNFADLCNDEDIDGAKDVMNAIDSIMVKEYHHSSLPGCHGIAIYLPNDTSQVDPGYYNNSYNLEFTASGNAWVDFIEWWRNK